MIISQGKELLHPGRFLICSPVFAEVRRMAPSLYRLACNGYISRAGDFGIGSRRPAALLVSRSTLVQDVDVNPLTRLVRLHLHTPALLTAEWRVPSVVFAVENGSGSDPKAAPYIWLHEKTGANLYMKMSKFLERGFPQR
jgi:hypothetical protein